MSEELEQSIDTVHFCTPCYGGQISEVTFSSYLRFTVFAMQTGINFMVDTLSNESNINRGRNSLVAKFLRNTCSHLMFVDGDIQFNNMDILKLLGANKDVIGGIYPQKVIPTKYVVNRLPDTEPEGRDGEIIEVDTLGTGFLLIKRSVFERMITEGVAQKYLDNIGLGAEFDDYTYNFFPTQIGDDGYYLTEDWAFCRNWRKMGGQIFADTSINLTHVGYHRFAGDTEILKETIKGNN